MQRGRIAWYALRHEPSGNAAVVTVEASAAHFGLAARLHRCGVRNVAFHLHLLATSAAHFHFLHFAVGHQRFYHHAHLLVFGASIGEVGIFNVEREVVSPLRARHLAWGMYMQCAVLQVDVRAAFFLHLLQYVVASGVVDDELGVGPGGRAVHLVITANALDYMG